MAVTTNWSDSTCAKSGLMAKSSVTCGVTLYFPVKSGFEFDRLVVQICRRARCAAAVIGALRLPVSDKVTLGISSSVRSVEMPSRPVMWPA